MCDTVTNNNCKLCPRAFAAKNSPLTYSQFKAAKMHSRSGEVCSELLAAIKFYESLEWPPLSPEIVEEAYAIQIESDWAEALVEYQQFIERGLKLWRISDITFNLSDDVIVWSVANPRKLAIYAPSSRDIRRLGKDILRVNDRYFKRIKGTFESLLDEAEIDRAEMQACAYH